MDSVDGDSPFHALVRDWLTAALNGSQRVGIPWYSLWAFVRIVTNSRVLANPLSPVAAWEHVAAWLDAPATWIPHPGRGHRNILKALLVTHDFERGCERSSARGDRDRARIAIVSADSDFARFPEIGWINPVATR